MNHILVTCRQKGKQQKHVKCLTIDDKSSRNTAMVMMVWWRWQRAQWDIGTDDGAVKERSLHSSDRHQHCQLKTEPLQSEVQTNE